MLFEMKIKRFIIEKHQCIKHKLVIALEDHRHLQSIITSNECHSIQQNWIVGSRKKVSVSHLTGIPLLLRLPSKLLHQFWI